MSSFNIHNDLINNRYIIQTILNLEEFRAYREDIATYAIRKISDDFVAKYEKELISKIEKHKMIEEVEKKVIEFLTINLEKTFAEILKRYEYGKKSDIKNV